MIRRLINYWDLTSFHLNGKVYYAGFAAVGLFVLSYFFTALFAIASLLLVLLAAFVAIDGLLLYQKKAGVTGQRLMQERFSNGDDNSVTLSITNHYPFRIKCCLIDELPKQLQERNWRKDLAIEKGETAVHTYDVRPVERGLYDFGVLNVYVTGRISLVTRRYRLPLEQTVRVYPSYVQMRRYQLLGAAEQFNNVGARRMRKLGHSMEFEQIKEYVPGDDYRTINWKATARHSNLMVNNYTDERSQQIYCLINKGRVMKMPFEGMTLLDYAINASLVVSSTALLRQDKAGVITFSQQIDSFLTADKKPTQLNQILELLYKQETNFMEPDFEKLFSAVRNRITQRSLLILFTNFESIESLQRQLPSLKKLAHYHLLMVVLFENTELKQFTETAVGTVEDIYVRTIADKYRFEKRLIVRELQKNGIIGVLSTPQELSINAMNKYLELKKRQSI
jgi:uncharacterized protein (DUF58 family)